MDDKELERMAQWHIGGDSKHSGKAFRLSSKNHQTEWCIVVSFKAKMLAS